MPGALARAAQTRATPRAPHRREPRRHPRRNTAARAEEESYASLRRDFSDAEIREAANARTEAKQRREDKRAGQVSARARANLAALGDALASKEDEDVPLSAAEADIQRKRLDGDWAVGSADDMLTLKLVVSREGDDGSDCATDAVALADSVTVEGVVANTDCSRVVFAIPGDASVGPTRAHFRTARAVDAAVAEWRDANKDRARVVADAPARRKRRVPFV